MVTLYRSDIGKKYVMAVTGLILLGYVLLHMAGNLKLYAGSDSLNHYAEFLRDVGDPVLPREALLWAFRIVLLGAVVLHLDAAVRLARKSRRARPVGYAAPRTYVAADFASRTMRWTGPIVGLFVVFHLLDLTWGTTNPDFVAGSPYENVVASFQRVPVALAYVVANLALSVHLYHGAWSLGQSLGWAAAGARRATRYAAIAFAAVVCLGNVSFPLAVLLGVID